MEIKVAKAGLEEIVSLRMLFLQENNFQFVHNKCHDYGWADTYLFSHNDIKIGYGAVWGKDKREDRDTIFEFYLCKPYRKLVTAVFKELHALSSTPFIECQTNDRLLAGILFEHAHNVSAEAILFQDHSETDIQIPGLIFQKTPAAANSRSDDLPYILKWNDEIVATGGLMLNYNFPYADVYYEVKEEHRRKGYGSFLVQELKKVAYHAGRVPSARCNIKNQVSKRTLVKAGFEICGYLLYGELT